MNAMNYNKFAHLGIPSGVSIKVVPSPCPCFVALLSIIMCLNLPSAGVLTVSRGVRGIPSGRHRSRVNPFPPQSSLRHAWDGGSW
eukprot:jgi/Botrbrau1/1625/Bobra.0185s0040.1